VFLFIILITITHIQGVSRL